MTGHRTLPARGRARPKLLAAGDILRRLPHGVAACHAPRSADRRPVGAFAERVPVRAVLACQAMRTHSLLLTAARVGGLMCMMWTAGACTHASANLMVDSPRLLKYEPPDIEEITGIDSDDTDQPAAHTGSAQAPRK